MGENHQCADTGSFQTVPETSLKASQILNHRDIATLSQRSHQASKNVKLDHNLAKWADCLPIRLTPNKLGSTLQRASNCHLALKGASIAFFLSVSINHIVLFWECGVTHCFTKALSEQERNKDLNVVSSSFCLSCLVWQLLLTGLSAVSCPLV